jgi:ferredoxin
MSRSVHVDTDTCVGSGWCVNLAGGVFRLGPNGKSTVVDPEGESPEAIEEAVDSCPVSAISVDDEPTEMKSPHA